MNSLFDSLFGDMIEVETRNERSHHSIYSIC